MLAAASDTGSATCVNPTSIARKLRADSCSVHCRLMETTVEPLEGNKVRLHVAVTDEEFDQAIDSAFRKLARQVKIPGFRPGKAPRRILEARLGSDVAREQALQ